MRRVAIIILVSYLVFVVGMVFAGFRAGINMTASLPLGLYLHDRAGEYERDSLVLVCLAPDVIVMKAHIDRLNKGDSWLCDGYTPVLKVVVGVAGDTIKVLKDKVTVNGNVLPGSAPVPMDGNNVPLKIAFGEHVLKAGEVWLMTTSKISYDSRYYGPVLDSGIVATSRPWITL